MVNISFSQPIVFGYTPPAASSGSSPNTTSSSTASKINNDIKAVTQAIKASVANTYANRNTLIVSGVALLIIAGLTVQNYYQNLEISRLNNDLNDFKSYHPHTSTMNTGPNLSDQFEKTPIGQIWTLDKPQCADILKFGNKSLDLNNFFQSGHDNIVEYLSQTPTKLTVKNGNMQYKHSQDTSRLAALLVHDCENTLEFLKPFLSKFGQSTLLDAAVTAGTYHNLYYLDILSNVLIESGLPPEKLPFSEILLKGKPQTPGSSILVEIPVDKILGASSSPSQFFHDTRALEAIAKLPAFESYLHGTLTKILENKENVQAEQVKKKVIEQINAFYPFNQLVFNNVLNDEYIASRVVSTPGLSAEVDRNIKNLRARYAQEPGRIS